VRTPEPTRKSPELDRNRLVVDVIIPALNEEATVGQVVRALVSWGQQPGQALRHIIVVDNGSTDSTAVVAKAAGAVVVEESQRGYGAACLRGMAFVAKQEAPPDCVVFLDADGSDEVSDLGHLLEALSAGADLVIGSRTLGSIEPGSLQPAQRAGNAVATSLIRVVYGQRYTDLGPFRIIRYPALRALGMSDAGYGWTVEMQVKAVRRGLHITEVPVHYHRRKGGESKISATMKGTVQAGAKILYTILRHSTQR
jgi:glycosyltransferase involved in cell wall biosynthesis